jgi:hypothetical protein
MSESTLYNEIIGELSHGDCRLFRQNAGFAWQGQVVEHTPNRLVLLNPRPLRMGVPGMSDLGGWVTLDVDVLNDARTSAIAVYTAIECKSARGRLTDEQSAFLRLVQRSGGRAGVARSVEDARLIIAGGTVA